MIQQYWQSESNCIAFVLDPEFSDIRLFDSNAQFILEANRTLANQFNQAESGLVRLCDSLGGVLKFLLMHTRYWKIQSKAKVYR